MPPCVAKACAVCPFFVWVVRSCGQQIQANVQGGDEANASNRQLVQGHSLRLLDETGSQGTSSTGDQKPAQSA